MSDNETGRPKDQGLSILDIGEIHEDVPVGQGKTLRVYGISAFGIFTTFQRFPEVGRWFKGGKLDMPLLMKEMPDAMAAVIAAGCGEAGNEKAEKNSARLPVEAQMNILEAIARLSFTSGFGPFVQRIVALSEAAGSLNYGRVLGTKSPEASTPVSPPDTKPSDAGT